MRAVLCRTPTLAGAALTLLGVCVSPISGAPISWSSPLPVNIDHATDTSLDNDFGPFMQVTDDGTWIAVWARDGRENEQEPFQQDVHISRSVDAGETWGTPTIYLDSPTDPSISMGPKIQPGGDGSWVVTWHANGRENGIPFNEGDIVRVRSLDDGITWSPKETLIPEMASDEVGADRPSLATDGVGTWGVAWRVINTENRDLGPMVVSLSADDAATWGIPVPISQPPASAEDYHLVGNPQIRMNSLGTAVAGWVEDFFLPEQEHGGHARIARSTGGGAWSLPQSVSDTAESPVSGELGSTQAEELFLQPDDTGTWVVAWEGLKLFQETPDARDIWVTRSTNDAVSWETPVNLTALDEPGRLNLSPTLQRGVSGEWLTVWVSRNSHSGLTLGADNDILCSWSLNGGETWSAPLAVNADAATDASSDDAPITARDGLGRWGVLWRHQTDGLRFAMASEAGGPWEQIPLPLPGEMQVGGFKDLQANAMGDWLIGWSASATSGTDSDIYVSAIQVTGEIGEIGDGLATAGEPYVGPAPTVVPRRANPVEWSLISGPPSMEIDAATGVVSWPDPSPSEASVEVTIRATNPLGSDEESWQVFVGERPTILVHPGNVAVGSNNEARFGVIAEGTEPLSHRWRKDGTDLADGGNISGASTPQLVISPATILDARFYDCVVTNPFGSATSFQATLAISYPAQIVDAILGEAPPPPGADVNGDGTIDISDVVSAIRQGL